MLATEGTVERGPAKGHGEKGTYYGLISGRPQLRIRRDDLAPGAPGSRPRRALLSFIHVTDIHLVDVQSPGRYEFMERLYGGPEVLRVALMVAQDGRTEQSRQEAA